MIPIFMYMKKSTKVIIAVVVVLVIIFLCYKMYDNGKKAGIELAREEETIRVVNDFLAEIVIDLGNLAYYIEAWNFGENTEYETKILSVLNRIKTEIEYRPMYRYPYDCMYELTGRYPNEENPYGALCIFYDNLQMFFANEEYMNNVAIWSYSSRDNTKSYYMEDKILSDEEKQYVSECCELIKISYERLVNKTNLTVELVRKALWVEDENGNSSIVKFVYK